MNSIRFCSGDNVKDRKNEKKKRNNRKKVKTFVCVREREKVNMRHGVVLIEFIFPQSQISKVHVMI